MEFKQKELEDHFHSFFKSFPVTMLFEVYDLETQHFIKFLGTQGSYVMNRDSVVSGLINMTLNQQPVKNLIVLKHMGGDIDFTNPVFIGTADEFRP